MSEEEFQARAKIILPRLAVSRQHEAVLRTAPVAERSDLTAPALSCQRIEFVICPNLRCSAERDQLEHVGLMNIAQPVTRFDEMIAGVKIAIVLQRRAEAADRRVDTQQMAAEIGLQCHIEELDEDPTYVTAHPLFEDVDQKAAVLFAACRTLW